MKLLFHSVAECCVYSEELKANYKSPGACELFAAAPEYDDVLSFARDESIVVSSPRDCEKTKWLPFLEATEAPPKAALAEHETIDYEAGGFCNICPAEYGYIIDESKIYCDEGGCRTCREAYDFVAAGFLPVVSCKDMAYWFAIHVGCCSLVMMEEPTTVPTISDFPRASDGRLCWVNGFSYGVAKDGACGDAEIIAVYATNDTVALGRTQGWWETHTDSIQVIPYGPSPFNISDCHEACINRGACGGWQFQSGACILKSELLCSPTLAKSSTSDSVAGVNGCVDINSKEQRESSAIDASNLWYLECDLPRCTAPHSYDGTWAGDTYIPGLAGNESCWYKQFTSAELFDGCARDRWIIFNGGSNVLSFFIQTVNLFAPMQDEGSDAPLVQFDQAFSSTVVDIVFKPGSLPVLNKDAGGILHLNLKSFCEINPELPCEVSSLSFQGGTSDWPQTYTTALEEVLSEAPYEAGATRLTLIVGQIWSNAESVLRAMAGGAVANGWENADKVFYGQAMIWYPCYIEGWCDLAGLGSTNEEMLQKYRLDLEGVMAAGEETCARNNFDCFLATHAYGNSIGNRAQTMVDILKELASLNDWAYLIDLNGFLLDDGEVVEGHVTPVIFLSVLTMILNTVCEAPEIGCPQAIQASPTCFRDCGGRGGGSACGGCNNWICMNSRQCNYKKLDPVPWEVVVAAPRLSATGAAGAENSLPVCFNATQIGVHDMKYADNCSRIWCGTIKDGWVVGWCLFLAGLALLFVAKFLSKARKRNENTEIVSIPTNNGWLARWYHLLVVLTFLALAEYLSKFVTIEQNQKPFVDDEKQRASLRKPKQTFEGTISFLAKNGGSERRVERILIVEVDIEAPAALPSKSTAVKTREDMEKKEHLKSLGFARFLASQHVVLGHLYAKGVTANVYFFGWGYTWVPWFFLLSGYVLTHARLNSSDATKVDAPFQHVGKRLATLFPMYVLGVILSMIIRIVKNMPFPRIDVLVGQSFLLQSWVPVWTEKAFLSQCWFLSNLLLYWTLFGWMYQWIRGLALKWTCLCVLLICVLPWLIVVIPATAGIEATWYDEHQFGDTGSAQDIWAVMLKFNPIFYIHVFLFGMLLAVLRNHLKIRDKRENLLMTFLTYITRFGAIIGYAGLILVFTVEEIQPIAHKLSARLSVLLPLQGLMLLGLSPLPQVIENKELYDPLALCFSFAPSWFGDFSYCQYVLQFIMYDLFPVKEITNASFFVYLWGASLVTYKLAQEPAAKLWRSLLPKGEKDASWYPLMALLVVPPSLLALILGIAKLVCEPFADLTSSFNTASGNSSGNLTNGTHFFVLPPFVQISDEAVDLRLNWTIVDESLPAEGKVRAAINPTMLFRSDGKGGIEWIRAVRAHAVHEEFTTVLYEGVEVTQQLMHFESSIMLSFEPFIGDLSAGFDGGGIARWGLDGSLSLVPLDTNLISHMGKTKEWTVLCEPKPSFTRSERWLVRKQVGGPEDPKLFELPNSALGISFSSFPPASILSHSSSAEDCKWHDNAVMQMYLATDGNALLSGEQALAVRLKCGNPKGMEKNWIAFRHEEKLYFVYSIEPHVIVNVRATDGACVEQYKTSSKQLKEVSQHVFAIRGSATAVRYSDGEFLAIFHTSGPLSGYSSCLYTFQAQPPFMVLRISKPLPLHMHSFPSSLVVHSNKVLVGYGEADQTSRVLVMSRNYVEGLFDWCGE
jgi:peptidoglycan/LPS O-acetylase OafA/YrhL